VRPAVQSLADRLVGAQISLSSREWIRDQLGEAGIGSSKIKAITKILREMDGKALVFSMFNSALDLIATALDRQAPDIKYGILDGSTAVQEREEIIRVFKEVRTREHPDRDS
jgi:SNF2 family DNA or RNA helicase